MKKLLSLLLAVAMLVSFAAISVSAETADTDPGLEDGSLIELPEDASEELKAFVAATEAMEKFAETVFEKLSTLDPEADVAAMIPVVKEIITEFTGLYEGYKAAYGALKDADFEVLADLEEMEVAELKEMAEMELAIIDSLIETVVTPVAKMMENEKQFVADVVILEEISTLLGECAEDLPDDYYDDLFGDIEIPDEDLELPDEDFGDLDLGLGDLTSLLSLEMYVDIENITERQFNNLNTIKAKLGDLSADMTAFLTSLGFDAFVEELDTYIAAYKPVKEPGTTTKPTTDNNTGKGDDEPNPSTGAATPIAMTVVLLAAGAVLVGSKKK